MGGLRVRRTRRRLAPDLARRRARVRPSRRGAFPAEPKRRAGGPRPFAPPKRQQPKHHPTHGGDASRMWCNALRMAVYCGYARIPELRRLIYERVIGHSQHSAGGPPASRNAPCGGPTTSETVRSRPRWRPWRPCLRVSSPTPHRERGWRGRCRHRFPPLLGSRGRRRLRHGEADAPSVVSQPEDDERQRAGGKGSWWHCER